MVFRTRIAVRGYELDTQGHLNQAVYLNYAEHARWEYLARFGITQRGLAAARIGPVQLECTVRYLRELRGGDEVDVSCALVRARGKTFRITQDYRRPSGELCARLTGVAGVLDLSARKLVDDPLGALRGLSDHPGLLDAELLDSEPALAEPAGRVAGD